MPNEKDFESAMNDFLESARSLENNIISTVSDSNSDVEMVLRELLVYLNSTSKFLEDIQSKIENFNTQTIELSRIPDKVDKMPSSMVKVAEEQTKQIFSALKKINDVNYKVINQTKTYSKYIYDMIKEEKQKSSKRDGVIMNIQNTVLGIESQLRSTEESVNENQANLMKIITEMMSITKDDRSLNAKTEQTKIQAEAEKTKQKILFWSKVVGIIFGSGGILYLLLDSIIKGSGG